MAVSNEVFLFGLEFIIYLVLGLSWNFNLFSVTGKEEDKNNVIRILFIWLLLWLMPLMTQYGLEIANDLGRSTNQITLYTVLYQVNIWVAIVVSILLIIYFIMNVMIYTSRVMER